jgi:N-acetylmuramoyl-L-alanine amidase
MAPNSLLHTESLPDIYTKCGSDSRVLSAMKWLLVVMLSLLVSEAAAQQVLPRISVATRSDGLGYVFRMHFASAPDSFKVFQPSADLIQVAVYKSGVNVSQVALPAPGGVVTRYEITAIPGGFGLNLHLAPNSFFLARAYPDANRNHLLLGLTRASARDLSVLTNGMTVIDWNRLSGGTAAAPPPSQKPSDTTRPQTPPSGTPPAVSPPVGQPPVRQADTTTTPTQQPTAVPPSNQAATNPATIPVTNPAPTTTPAPANQSARLRTIVLDAGHGGRDPGAIGPARNQEKVIALAVTKKLGAYINEHLPDVNVVYTRTDDRFIDLHERGSIANRAQGDLFVSIHANAHTTRQPSGTEVYFLGVARTQSALEAMKRENSVIMLENPASRTRELTEEELILYELTNVGYMAASQRIAGKMDEQFTNRAGRHSRGVKQAGFIVLYQASMPAVLVELGFISNPAEERFMASENGQNILASALFRAIRDYKVALENNTLYSE